MSDYAYHVFISYRRVRPFTEWLEQIFLDVFKGELAEELGEEPRLFWDKEEIPTGATWSDILKEGLRRSCCLVPIWSSQYFRSAWCVSEWKSFAKRGPQLIVPIRWTEGLHHFPESALKVQMADFSRFAYVGRGFKDSPEFFEMQKQTRKFARNVAQAVGDAPTFVAGDPRFEPEQAEPELPPAKVRLQALGVPQAATP